MGDTWTQNGVVYACTTAKTASGSFAQSDWTKAGDITSQNQSASTATIGNHTQDDLPSGINYGRVALPYLDGTGRITNFYDWRAARLRQFDSLAGKQTASFTGGDVSDIPAPLSDGRVGMAIDLSGKIKTGWYTARKIAGINFDGTADIAIPRGNLTGTIDSVPDGTNYRRTGAGYVDTSGRLTAVWDGTTIRQGTDIGTAVSRANTALDASGYLRTRFATPRTIAGVDFDGSANIAIPSTGLSDGTALARGGDSITRFGDRTLDYIDDSPSFERRATGTYGEVDVANANFTAPIVDGKVPGWSMFGEAAPLGYRQPSNYPGQSGLDWTTTMDGNGPRLDRKYPVQAGDSVYASCRAYCYAGGTLSLRVAWYDANDTFISNITGTGVGVYPLIEVQGIAPSNAAYFQLRFFANAGQSTLLFPRVRINDVRIAGSGARLGDLRNQVAVGYANFGAGWSGGNISYTASSDGTATINVSSATLQAGSIALTYSASSASVSGGHAGGISVYYLYYDDPDSSGGAKTLHATTSQITSLASDGRRLVGQITVTFPSSGSGSGGGDFGCITPDAYVMIHRASETRIITAGELQKTYRTGDYIRAVEPSTGLEWWQQIDSVQLGVANGVTVTTTNGCQLTCTDIAWLGQPDGSRIRAKDTQGQSLYTRAGSSEASVTTAGTIDIVKIMSGGVFFLASSDGQNWLAHHNMKPPT
ncbi:MAG TPA: hypothetical protein VFL78_07675 [Rhodanobacteraceae bacterium]|nr:hypothetical protein [Rhodanobacteraceae bacterium]